MNEEVRSVNILKKYPQRLTDASLFVKEQEKMTIFNSIIYKVNIYSK